MPTLLKRLSPKQAVRAFGAMSDDARGALNGLHGLIEAGKYDEWYERFDGVLLGGHTDSWRFGRVLGGGDDGVLDEDRLYGRALADQQGEFLLGFLDDLEAGRYTDADGNLLIAQIEQRSNLYVKAFRGTANESWTTNGADDELYDWVLGVTEDHCDDCPELASLSPFAKDTIFTWPGKGQTQCLVSCTCSLRARSTGLTGF